MTIACFPNRTFRTFVSLAAAVVFLIVSGTRIEGARPGQTTSSKPAYGDDQARRGKTVFTRSCQSCHALQPDGKLPLVGTAFVQKWRTVGDLWSKIHMSMPADHVAGLPTDDYLDVLSFILQSNGIPPGGAPLKNDVPAMHRMLLTVHTPADHQTVATGHDVAHGFYYTSSQANRGKAYFSGSCTTCHVADRFAGDAFREKWQSVANLFNKMRTTMPLHDSRGLSTETYVDIVAYALQLNGFPAGDEELPSSLGLMKNMMLAEPGFQRLFNGKDLTGFKVLLGNGCTPPPAGCGLAEPGSTFRVDQGTIVASGRPPGYMYTAGTYKDFVLRLEYMFPRPADLESDDQFYGNSGYLLFMRDQDLKVWPRGIEMQGRNLDVLSVILLGGKGKISVDADARARAIKPVGQWNAVEISSASGRITGLLNGAVVSTITDHEYAEPGHIGLQSEGSEIHWRNVRIKVQ